MTFTWDFNTATLLAIATQIILSLTFIIRTASKAATAHDLAATTSERLAALSASFSLFREQVARDYVDNIELRAMKDELMGSLNRISERIDKVLERKD